VRRDASTAPLWPGERSRGQDRLRPEIRQSRNPRARRPNGRRRRSARALLSRQAGQMRSAPGFRRQQGRRASSLGCAGRVPQRSPTASSMSSEPRRPRNPRNAGLARERGTDPLSNFAGLGVTRPAFEETRYFPPTVVGDRRAEVTLGPAGGEYEVRASTAVETSFSVISLLRCMPGEPLIAGAGGDLCVPVAGDQQAEDSLMALTQTSGLVASTQSAASDTPARRTGAIASTVSASVIALRLKYSGAAPMAAWPGHQEAVRGRTSRVAVSRLLPRAGRLARRCGRLRRASWRLACGRCCGCAFRRFLG